MTTTVSLDQELVTAAGTADRRSPPDVEARTAEMPAPGEWWVQLFIACAGGIFLADALIRLLSVAGRSEFLTFPDPLFGIPVRWAALSVGGLELGVALLCLFGKRLEWRLALVAWASTNLIVAWVGLWSLGFHSQWSAIGTLTDPLQLARSDFGMMLRVAPGGLLLGSGGALLWLWFGRRMLRRRQQVAELLKMFCPGCGGHIKFASANIGQRVPCPHCRKVIALRKPEDLKMACFFCRGNIVFPVHALGTKMPCPHCQKDITLIEPK